MLERMRPRVIRADDECERLTDEFMRLDDLEKPSHAEAQMTELLTLLIEEYEQRRHPVPHAAPQQVLLQLMEARRPEAEGFAEDFRIEGSYIRSDSRKPRDQQGASEEAGGFFSCERGAFYLTGELRASTRSRLIVAAVSCPEGAGEKPQGAAYTAAT